MNDRSFSRSPAITLSRQSVNDKRQRILDAAIEVFARRGFYHAKVTEVAEEAGVAGGTIYLYFKNKDDLLISLFEDRMAAILDHFREELAPLTHPDDRLRRFIELHLEMVEQSPALAEVLTVELRQSAKFMREYKARQFGEYLALLESILDEGQRSGAFRPDLDPRILKRVLFGALDEVSLFFVDQIRINQRPPYALDRAAAQIWSVCSAGVTDPSRPAPPRSEP
ncbi:MAG: TetR/AcrR family transcriptional regulator [Myxococcales bacterium]|nr:TetR/AcrR family transcriptional regulator [Myxococcales bacterium]